MSGPSYTGTFSGGLVVTVEIAGAHPRHTSYPLLPGDLLIDRGDGTFGKFGPGLGIEGFILTDAQRETLEPSGDREFGMGGMDYFLGGGS